MTLLQPGPTGAVRQVVPGPPYPVNAEGAKITLALGIISWFFCLFLAGIPAIILGHRTLKKIAESRGRLKGKEIALAGLILGYSGLTVWLLVFIGWVVAYKVLTKDIPAHETSAIATLRQINEAEASYVRIYADAHFGRYYAGSLATLGPGPTGNCPGTGTAEYACLMDGPLVKPECREPQWCVSNGYKFQLQRHSSGQEQDYAITATPVENIAGNRNFCSTSDGIVRASTAWATLTSGWDSEDCKRLKPAE